MDSSREPPPARAFAGPDEFWAWLEEHHATESELWIRLSKKQATDGGLTWKDAVPVALCWGWIDSQVHRIDETHVRQRWTPRKPTSNWSRVNLAMVERLITEGRMQPSGLAAYESRKPSTPYSFELEQPPELPSAYTALMQSSPAAMAFWGETTASYRRVCIHWVVSAKQESTRERRMRELIEDHAAGRMIRSQRYGVIPRWVQRAAQAAADV